MWGKWVCRGAKKEPYSFEMLHTYNSRAAISVTAGDDLSLTDIGSAYR